MHIYLTLGKIYILGILGHLLGKELDAGDTHIGTTKI